MNNGNDINVMNFSLRKRNISNTIFIFFSNAILNIHTAILNIVCLLLVLLSTIIQCHHTIDFSFNITTIKFSTINTEHCDFTNLNI